MVETKTKPTPANVDDFIAAVEKPVRRADAIALRAMMERIAGEPATMWGPTIIGFGAYHYRYASGHEGDSCAVGFSPRKAQLVFYLAPGEGLRDGFLARLGKHKTDGGCLYVKRLSDIDTGVLAEMAVATMANRREEYPG